MKGVYDLQDMDIRTDISRISIGNRKVAIIGVGYVGASIAYALSIRNLASEIVLIDKDFEKAIGEALDIQHGIPYMGVSVVYAGSYSDCRDCDLIIICAGKNRRRNENRLDLANDNLLIMKSVIGEIKKYYTRGTILIVSNPVDILTYAVDKWMELPNGYVMGTGCSLDTSRLVSRVANYVHLNTEVVKGFVVGEHGDTQIPVWSRFSIAGIPIEEYCQSIRIPWGREQMEYLNKDIKEMGAVIIQKKERTHYGIATCVCYLADAILNQRPTIFSVSSTLQGEYGTCEVALSVPSIIGFYGVERRLEERWTEKEYKAFKRSADIMKNFIKSVNFNVL